MTTKPKQLSLFPTPAEASRLFAALLAYVAGLTFATDIARGIAKEARP